MTFSNNKCDFFKNVGKLPDELIGLIKCYIPKCVTIFLTKENYQRDHHLLLKTIIDKKLIEEYIRVMIRQDNDYVLYNLLVENQERWLGMKNYYYRSGIYNNYLSFLKSYCLDHDADNCYNLLINLFEELGLSKNQHKKNAIRYIRWKR